MIGPRRGVAVVQVLTYQQCFHELQLPWICAMFLCPFDLPPIQSRANTKVPEDSICLPSPPPPPHSITATTMLTTNPNLCIAFGDIRPFSPNEALQCLLTAGQVFLEEVRELQIVYISLSSNW